jgi:hypothetical protein
MFRMQERKQQRDRNRFNLRLLQLLHQFLQVVVVERLDYLARSNNALLDAETKFVSNQRRRLDGVEIVEFRTRLPADHEHVFKSFCRDQRDARAATLQQGVRADSRAVNDFDLIQS